MRATVFELDPGEWRVVLSGQILPTIYDSRGSAVTGLETERRNLLDQLQNPEMGAASFATSIVSELKS